MKIKVNDYVRIVDDLGKQFIGKVYNINDYREPNAKYAIDCQIFNDYAFVGEERIVKSSPNIIDLIEVGDYVNGRIVDDYIYLDKLGLIGLTELEKEDEKFIKSIVTKEMFEKMEYKIN